MVATFPYIVKVKLAINVCNRRSKPLPYPKIVCFGDRGEVCGNRFKRGVEDVAPYKQDVRFAYSGNVFLPRLCK